jgi:hypothetical protein
MFVISNDPTMNFQAKSQQSTFQELTNFLSVLNNGNNSGQPLLKNARSVDMLVMHLEKQLPKAPQPAIFRRLGKHRQLALHFS